MMGKLDLKILNILQLEFYIKMLPPTCPKCQSQYKEIDNFCIDCGKDLRTIKIKNLKKNKKR